LTILLLLVVVEQTLAAAVRVVLGLAQVLLWLAVRHTP
jgi:hypothetical protein